MSDCHLGVSGHLWANRDLAEPSGLDTHITTQQLVSGPSQDGRRMFAAFFLANRRRKPRSRDHRLEAEQSLSEREQVLFLGFFFKEETSGVTKKKI